MAEELGYPTLIEAGDGTVELNAAARKVLRNGYDDLFSALRDVFDGELSEALASAVEAGRNGQRVCLRIDGLKVVLLPSPGGVAVVVAQDPDEVVTLARRAAAGEMAAGVAHEVANALSSVIGWCSLAKSDPKSAPPDVALDRAAQGAQVARDAARQLMQWGSPRLDGPGERLDAVRIVRDVAALLRPAAIEAGVTIDLEGGAPVFVEAHRPELVSVVWNHAQNAIRALPRGGRLSLSAEAKGDTVRIRVTDNGPGMSPEVARRAVERRFTTHPEGFGLGLPLVLRTVDEMAGRIKLDTAEGLGCHFVVELPMTRHPTPATGLPTLKPSGVRGRVRAEGQRVLVVEDDPGLRELLTTMLEIQGFTVEAVADPRRAIELGRDCDIALVDLNLEHGRGDRVLEALRESGFAGASAIMSGGEAPGDLAEGAHPDRWLRKPFDPTELMAHLLELRGLIRKKRRPVG
jgi:signal transduction histidine kinase/CheY-like chemotaxis protein